MTEEPRKPYRRLRKPKRSFPWKGLAGTLLLAGAVAWGIHWTKGRTEASLDELRPHMQDGIKHGFGRDHRACIDEVLATVGGCGDDESCRAANQAFLMGCMQSADTEGFCDVAPRYPSAQEEWATERCYDAGVAGEACEVVLFWAPASCSSKR